MYDLNLIRSLCDDIVKEMDPNNALSMCEMFREIIREGIAESELRLKFLKRSGGFL